MAVPQRIKLPHHEGTVVGYVRVSTEDQAQNGVSIRDQEERIRARCVADNRHLSEIIRDRGESASSLKRPGLQHIMKGVRSGNIGTVVVFKLDRLTRSVRDLGELLELFIKNDSALVSVSESLDTGTAGGRLVLNMLGSVSQWEREAAAERTAMALAHLRRHRRPYAPTAFGWTRRRMKLVPNVSQQKALRFMKRLRKEGATFRTIAGELESRGIRAPRGKVWYASSVRAVLVSRMTAESVTLLQKT